MNGPWDEDEFLQRELADVKRIGATPLSAAEIKESDEIAIRHEIESGSSQARFAILDAYYAGLARARWIFGAPLNDDEMEMATMRRAFKESEERVAILCAQNAELLAALRECALTLEIVCALATDRTPVSLIHVSRQLFDVRALIARAEGQS